MDQDHAPQDAWRGHGATRLEALVDASFAFAVTLLVISAERIPDSVASLLLALKQVPAFAAGFALLTLFWYAHVRWSRHYLIDLGRWAAARRLAASRVEVAAGG